MKRLFWTRHRGRAWIGVLVCSLFLLWLDGDSGASVVPPGEAQALVDRMDAAYVSWKRYQMEVEITEFRDGREASVRRFLYSFAKPDHLRLDLESPDRGTILIYPDAKGKVLVKQGGWKGFATWHLALESAFLRNDSGQRLDQTDLGSLIRNIGHSLSGWRQGPATVEEQEGRVTIEVLSRDHFRPKVTTLYRFQVDKTRWLPVGVEERSSGGELRRRVNFRNLRQADFPAGFFLTP